MLVSAGANTTFLRPTSKGQTSKEAAPDDLAFADLLGEDSQEDMASAGEAPIPSSAPQNAFLRDPVQMALPMPAGKAGAPSDPKIFEEMEDISQAMDQLTNELGMLTFLRKMQTEFGVEPEKIVQAFTQLSAADLQKPPEDNAEKIVAQLGLTKEQEPKARDYFLQMLAATAPHEKLSIGIFKQLFRAVGEYEPRTASGSEFKF